MLCSKEMKMNSELISEKIKYIYLRRHPLFDQLDEDQLQHIGSRIRMKKLRRNQVITISSDLPGRLYIIGDGTIKLIRSDKWGNNFLSDILVEGDLFGDTFLSGVIHGEYAVVLKNNTVVLHFQAEEFINMMRNNHRLALNFTTIICNRLRHISERYAIWNTGDAKERLRYFFRGWASCAGEKVQNRIILQNYFSLSDIADFICVSRQFMHIMLKELKSEGLLYYGKKEIDIAVSFLSDELTQQKQAV